MGQRATVLAERFGQMNQEIIKTVERCSDAQWQVTTSGERWPVGVVAHHVAESHKGIARLIQMAASGQTLPALTPEVLDKGNAEHAKTHAKCTKAETLELLRRNADSAATTVRGLADEQLDRKAPVFAGGGPMSVQQMIEGILIGHVREHLDGIRAAIGARASSA